MKKIIGIMIFSFAGLAFLTLTAGCGRKGSGRVVTEERKVSAFTKISVSGVFPVEISQTGEPVSVKVQTDENLQDIIRVYNDGDWLYIETKEDAKIRRSTKMKVYINIAKMDELEYQSVGSLNTKGTLKLDSLELYSETVGKLNLNIEADYLRLNLNSVGSTTLKGKVREARINNKSIGTLSAYDLKAGILMIHNTAVGTAEVYADSAFYIRSSSIGTLHYKGPGQVKELKSEGIGKVEKKQ